MGQLGVKHKNKKVNITFKHNNHTNMGGRAVHKGHYLNLNVCFVFAFFHKKNISAFLIHLAGDISSLNLYIYPESMFWWGIWPGNEFFSKLFSKFT